MKRGTFRCRGFSSVSEGNGFFFYRLDLCVPDWQHRLCPRRLARLANRRVAAPPLAPCFRPRRRSQAVRFESPPFRQKRAAPFGAGDSPLDRSNSPPDCLFYRFAPQNGVSFRIPSFPPKKGGTFRCRPLAERRGFEPLIRYQRIHDFQSCAFDQLSHLST